MDAVVVAPGFCLGVRCSAEEIAGIDFLAPRPGIEPTTPLAREAARQLNAWLADPSFRFSLPLAPAGTAFQRRVWSAIAAIPRGGTQTYGELAHALSSSPRAVGGACGANPCPIIVPCHRVVAAGRGLGGFARNRGGFLLDIKRWLLDHERRPQGRPKDGAANNPEPRSGEHPSPPPRGGGREGAGGE